MYKKHDEKTEPEKVNQPAGAPVVQEAAAPVSREVLSHQWQENSPAINTNVLAGYGNQDSVLDKIDTKENLEAREETAKAALDRQEELLGYADVDCSRLDVSDPRYCNPGSERHQAFLKKRK